MTETNEWNETLCGCFNDCGICCYGFWCAPCLFGSNAKKLDGSSCCVNCCVFCVLGQVYQSWLPHYFKRQKLRQVYGLREDSTCGDVAATLCCSSCALCQEAREMKTREKARAKATIYTPSYHLPAQPSYNRQQPQDIYDSRAF